MSGSWVYVTRHVFYVFRRSSSVVVALIVAITVVTTVVAVVVIVVVANVIATVNIITVAIVSSFVVYGCHHIVLPWPFVLLSVIGSSILWVVPSKTGVGFFLLTQLAFQQPS